MASPNDPNNSNPDLAAIVKDLQDKKLAETNKLLEAQKEALKNILNISQNIEEVKEKTNAALDESAKIYKDMDQKVNNIKKNYDNIVDAEQILSEAEQDRLAALEENYKLNQKNYLLLLEQIEAETDPARQKLLEEQRKVLLERIISQGKELKNDQDIKKGKEAILSLGKQILQEALKYTNELEKHILNISKLNGGYASVFGNLREANRSIYAATAGTGMMFEEANTSFASLSQNFIGLSTQSAKSIKDMAVGAAQLAKLGVDIGSATKGFDSLVNGMGKTPQQAYKIQESFVQMAAKNRLALGAVSQAFAENSSRFVGYGEQMTKVLDGLAEQSLKTGIAIGKLVSIAQGFDTFEDASRKVGNLNALLGGDYFNSIELLTASDEERIKLLKEGVAASGLQFENMNRFQKMAIANAAGITDLNEASKLFGQTSLQNTRQQAEQAEVQKTLAEQAESVSLSMDKMRSAINGVMIVLDPLVEIFAGFVKYIILGPITFAQWISKLTELNDTAHKFIIAIVSIGNLLAIWAVKNVLFGGSFSSILNGIKNVITSIPQYIASLKAKKAAEDIASRPSPAAVPAAAGAGPAGATSGFLSNAGNMLRAAGAILLFAAALFVLAKALQEFSSDKINSQGIAFAATSIIVLLGVFKVIDKATGQISKGALAVGIMAIALIALGFALYKFKDFDWRLVAGVGAIILGLGLAIAGFGMAVSGPQAILIAAGIAMIIGISAALLILGNSLEKISTSFKTLSELKNIGELSTNLIKFLDDLADTSVSPIKNLAEAIGLLAENLQKLASISSNMAINVSGNARTVLTEQVNAAATAVTKTSEAISAATATKTTQALIPAQQTTAFVPLVVQIDKKTIIEILDVEGIAKGTTLDTLNKVGIVQSGFYAQDIIPQTTND